MRTLLACLMIVPVALLSACAPARGGSPPPTAAPAAPGAVASPFPITLVDDAGRTVTIPAQPRRIVSISASNTEILFALGLEDRIVAVDQYSDFPPAAKEKPKVGSYLKPDLERIMAVEPDLILGTGIHLKTTLPELENRRLPVAIVDPRDVKGVLEKITLVAKATGQQKEGEALVAGLQARVDAVEARLKGAQPVRVFFELSPSLHTAGPGSFVDDLLRLAGGANIAAGAGKEWPQLSQESLFLADPEVILMADHEAGETPERAAARPGWRQMAAVKAGRVFAIDPNLTNRPGPRVIDGLEVVAKTLHPDRMR